MPDIQFRWEKSRFQCYHMRRIIFRGAADIALRHKAHGAVGGRVGVHAAILTAREPEKVLSEKGEILVGREKVLRLSQ